MCAEGKLRGNVAAALAEREKDAVGTTDATVPLEQAIASGDSTFDSISHKSSPESSLPLESIHLRSATSNCSQSRSDEIRERGSVSRNLNIERNGNFFACSACTSFSAARAAIDLSRKSSVRMYL